MEHRPVQTFGRNTGRSRRKSATRPLNSSWLLKANSQHPSLQFKKIGERNGQEIWSARVTLNYRTLAIKRADGYIWFWIGDHKTYDALIS